MILSGCVNTCHTHRQSQVRISFVVENFDESPRCRLIGSHIGCNGCDGCQVRCRGEFSTGDRCEGRIADTTITCTHQWVIVDQITGRTRRADRGD